MFDKGRSSYLDSLKGCAILLVVYGHLIEAPRAQPFGTFVYNSIYMFHMPLFVFLAGITTSKTIDGFQAVKIIRSIVIPFVLFQAIYTYWGAWFYGAPQYPTLAPYWVMWFLLSLIFWKLLLPLFASPLGLSLSLVSTLAAGYYPEIGFLFSASRTVYFFPFFIIGCLYGRDILKWSKRHKRKAWLLLPFMVAVTTIWTVYGLNERNLTGAWAYTQYTALTNFPAMGRLLIMLTAYIGIIGFCALVPQKWRPLAYLGKRSITIYLIHGLFVIWYRTQGPSAYLLPYAPIIAIPASIMLAYGAAWAFHRPLQLLFDVIMAAGRKLNSALPFTPLRHH